MILEMPMLLVKQKYVFNKQECVSLCPTSDYHVIGTFWREL